MSDELLIKVQQLLDSGVGDAGRLSHIQESLKNGKQLYNSDKKFLDVLITKYLETTYSSIDAKSIPKVQESIIDDEEKSDTVLNAPKEVKTNSPVQFSKSDVKYVPSEPPRIIRGNGSYGVSNNTRYQNDVKIHIHTCRFYQNSSQKGSVKWSFSHNLSDAVNTANRICSHDNQWRYAQCCQRRADYVYKCKDCNNLTIPKRQPSKKILGIISLIFVGLPLLYNALLFSGGSVGVLNPNIDPLFYQLSGYTGGVIFFFVVIILPVFYYAHGKTCTVCRTKHYR